MRVSADNEADRDYRVVRKSDGVEVPYVVQADTGAGTYKQAVIGDDGHLVLSHYIRREVIEANGARTYYDEDGNECDEPEFVFQEVAEPFRIVHVSTREVIAETADT